MVHPLDGCRAKLDRAKETIASLARDISSFELQSPLPFKITREHRGAEYVFIASGETLAPLRFSVLAGEAVHHMRSSLDHLVSALVVSNGNTPSRAHQFPICATEKDFESAINRKQLDGVSSSAKDIIRSMQPFQNAVPDDTVLSVVAQYDNADKHRLLVIVNAAAKLGANIAIGPDPAASLEQSEKQIIVVGLGNPGPTAISPQGEVVFSIAFHEPSPHVMAEAQFTPVVVFEKCGIVAGAPVANMLNGICDVIRSYIELFANEFSEDAIEKN